MIPQLLTNTFRKLKQQPDCRFIHLDDTNFKRQIANIFLSILASVFVLKGTISTVSMRLFI